MEPHHPSPNRQKKRERDKREESFEASVAASSVQGPKQRKRKVHREDSRASGARIFVFSLLNFDSLSAWYGFII
jgi:hypothetical protein